MMLRALETNPFKLSVSASIEPSSSTETKQIDFQNILDRFQDEKGSETTEDAAIQEVLQNFLLLLGRMEKFIGEVEPLNELNEQFSFHLEKSGVKTDENMEILTVLVREFFSIIQNEWNFMSHARLHSLNPFMVSNQQHFHHFKNDFLRKSILESGKLIEQITTILNNFENNLDNGKNTISFPMLEIQNLLKRLMNENRLNSLLRGIQLAMKQNGHIDSTFLSHLTKMTVKHHELPEPFHHTNVTRDNGNFDHVSPKSPLLNTNFFSKPFHQPVIELTLSNLFNDSSIKEEFTAKFIDIMKSSKFFRTMDGKSTLTIQLHPEHLGSLTVKLVQEKKDIVAKIIASTQSAKELLEHSIGQLKHALPNVKIEIDRFELFDDIPLPMYQQHKEEQPSKEQKEKEQSMKEDKEPSQSFSEKLEQQFNKMI